MRVRQDSHDVEDAASAPRGLEVWVVDGFDVVQPGVDNLVRIRGFAMQLADLVGADDGLVRTDLIPTFLTGTAQRVGLPLPNLKGLPAIGPEDEG